MASAMSKNGTLKLGHKQDLELSLAQLGQRLTLSRAGLRTRLGLGWLGLELGLELGLGLVLGCLG